MPERHLLAVRRRTVDGRELVAVEVVAREAGLHPDLVRRLIALGALDRESATSASNRLPEDAGAQLARIIRLRHDLGLNYAGAMLASDLIARIEELEDLLARTQRGARPRPRR